MKTTNEVFLRALRDRALGHPGTREGVACEGTAIEMRTIKARDKAFLFLGRADAMLKLGTSLAAAKKLATREPHRYRAGAGGWVKITLDGGASPPLAVVAAWVDESYSMIAAKKVLAKAPRAKAPPRAAARARARASRKT